jgi:hypothetical protein
MPYSRAIIDKNHLFFKSNIPPVISQTIIRQTKSENR